MGLSSHVPKLSSAAPRKLYAFPYAAFREMDFSASARASLYFCSRMYAAARLAKYTWLEPSIAIAYANAHRQQ